MPHHGVTTLRETNRVSSAGVTQPSSLIRAHAPNHCPPCASGFPRAHSLCRLLPAPAAQWPFPTLALPFFPYVPGPIPRRPPRCSRSFLPLEHWPPPNREWVGAVAISQQPLQLGRFSRLQSFTNVQARKFARRTGSSHPHYALFRIVGRPRLLRPRISRLVTCPVQWLC